MTTNPGVPRESHERPPTVPTDSESALDWLTLKAWAGAVTFCSTENGDIGLFLGDEPQATGVGDTCDEALWSAHRSYHETPGREACACSQLVEDGDTLND